MRGSPMGLWEGKVAVITEAGSGMGKASTEVSVQEGAKAVATDSKGAEKATAAEMGEDLLQVRCDVARDSGVEAMVQLGRGAEPANRRRSLRWAPSLTRTVVGGDVCR